MPLNDLTYYSVTKDYIFSLSSNLRICQLSA